MPAHGKCCGEPEAARANEKQIDVDISMQLYLDEQESIMSSVIFKLLHDHYGESKDKSHERIG